jgi:hypothetical protein
VYIWYNVCTSFHSSRLISQFLKDYSLTSSNALLDEYLLMLDHILCGSAILVEYSPCVSDLLGATVKNLIQGALNRHF